METEQPPTHGTASDTPPGRTTVATTTDLELRRTLVFKLRTERRLSYRDISAALQRGTVHQGQPVTFTISASSAHADYWHVMREEGYTPDPDQVEHHRASELQKCDQLEKGLAPQAHAGNPQAVNSYLRVMARRARLLGIDAPVRVAGHDGGPVQVELAAVTDDVALAAYRTMMERRGHTLN